MGRFIQAIKYNENQINIKIDKNYCQVLVICSNKPEESENKGTKNTNNNNNPNKPKRPKTFRNNYNILEETVNLPFYIKRQNLFNKITIKFYKNHGIIRKFPENPKKLERLEKKKKIIVKMLSKMKKSSITL